jgi:hypothetical protein
MFRRNKWHNGVVISSNGTKRLWVVLSISQQEIESQGLNADKEGFYGFGGMWYGDDPYDFMSYGKIIKLDESDITFDGVIENYNLQELKDAVD